MLIPIVRVIMLILVAIGSLFLTAAREPLLAGLSILTIVLVLALMTFGLGARGKGHPGSRLYL